MYIIGRQKLFASSDDNFEAQMAFYGSLPGQIRASQPANTPMRRVHYTSNDIADSRMRFAGFVVPQKIALPAGAVVWELTDNQLIIHSDQLDHFAGKYEIHWLWRHTGPRPAGEFVVNSEGALKDRKFWLSLDAYIAQEGQGACDEVELVTFDTSWPVQFAVFADWLRETLGDVVQRVEHFGSTAISGMSAKPVIDVMVEVPSVAEAKQRIIPVLCDPEWEYCWYDDHMMFIKRAGLGGTRTHHVHIAPAGDKLWERLAFRDYLRAHLQDAARYAALKQELAIHYRDDRERYTVAKGEFIREIMSRAEKS
jgi:GrpB-like predicted nucleotidyltransferase (UPF0157 family)